MTNSKHQMVDQMQHLPSVLEPSPSVPQTLSKNETAAAARLPLSQSLDIASDLLAQFPHCKAEDGFLRSMAELFNQYPAGVVTQITNMKTGIATHAEFLSLAAMTAWLDQQSEGIYKAADWDRRAQRQIENRDKPLESQPLLRKMQDWTAKRQGEIAEEDKKLRAIQDKRSKEFMAESNEARAAEYHRAGLDPIYADEDHTIVCSLPMMLHMGWKIGEIDGRKALVRA